MNNLLLLLISDISTLRFLRLIMRSSCSINLVSAISVRGYLKPLCMILLVRSRCGWCLKNYFNQVLRLTSKPRSVVSPLIPSLLSYSIAVSMCGFVYLASPLSVQMNVDFSILFAFARPTTQPCSYLCPNQLTVSMYLVVVDCGSCLTLSCCWLPLCPFSCVQLPSCKPHNQARPRTMSRGCI